MRNMLLAAAAAFGLWSSAAQASVTVPGGSYAILHFSFSPGADVSVIGNLFGSAGSWVDFGNGIGEIDMFVEHGIWSCDGPPIACRPWSDPDTGTVIWSTKIAGDDLWFRIDNLAPNKNDCASTHGKWCFIAFSPVTIDYWSDQDFRLDVKTGAVPEPSTWALMIAGFGMVGAMARSRRRGIA